MKSAQRKTATGPGEGPVLEYAGPVPDAPFPPMRSGRHLVVSSRGVTRLPPFCFLCGHPAAERGEPATYWTEMTSFSMKGTIATVQPFLCRRHHRRRRLARVCIAIFAPMSLGLFTLLIGGLEPYSLSRAADISLHAADLALFVLLVIAGVIGTRRLWQIRAAGGYLYLGGASEAFLSHLPGKCQTSPSNAFLAGKHLRRILGGSLRVFRPRR